MSTSTNINCNDILNLSSNAQCQRMLNKYGDNVPQIEKVTLSAQIIKINKRNKEQNRIFLLTDKALYQLKPKELNKCNRRYICNDITSIFIFTDLPNQ